MSTKARAKVRLRRQRADFKPTSSIFEKFHCTSIRYDFDLPIESFRMKEFSEETGISIGETWSAALPTGNPKNGYHAHFNGKATRDRVEFKIEYFNTVLKRGPDHPAPSAEKIMAFVGSFIVEPRQRTIVYGHFQNQEKNWRSRFNLPFKVTLAGKEVAIDGVSLILPKNEFGALNGWVTKIGTMINASVDLIRIVEFSSFKLEREVAILNESTKLFVEQMT